MMRVDEEAIPSEAAGQGRGEYKTRRVFKEVCSAQSSHIITHPSAYLEPIMGAL